MMLYEGDCLEIMPTLADKSVDMILCDLPYGTTACKWDTIIPFEPLWKQYKRLIKDNGAIVLTAAQPFTTAVIISNREWFKYEWVWIKNKVTNIFLARKQPLKSHENIVVFYKKQPSYNPQLEERLPNSHPRKGQSFKGKGIYEGSDCISSEIKNGDTCLAKSVQYFTADYPILHPTQKPVALFEYLIRTYTNEGETVLDNCAGSGTTGIACINTNRKYILIEKDKGYCEIIRKRIANTQPLLMAS